MSYESELEGQSEQSWVSLLVVNRMKYIRQRKCPAQREVPQLLFLTVTLTVQTDPVSEQQSLRNYFRWTVLLLKWVLGVCSLGGTEPMKGEEKVALDLPLRIISAALCWDGDENDRHQGEPLGGDVYLSAYTSVAAILYRTTRLPQPPPPKDT